MNESNKETIIAVGDKIFCTAFKLAGIETYEVYDEKAFNAIIDKGTIIIVQEELYNSFSNNMKKAFSLMLKPSIISVSLSGIQTGESLEQLMKKALGVSIK
jgi:vacuolar-type H+-ATPase subunit F/Vma7